MRVKHAAVPLPQVDDEPYRLLTVAEVAAVVSLDESTVRRHLSTGKLRGVLVGGRSWRIDPDALADYIRGTEGQ